MAEKRNGWARTGRGTTNSNTRGGSHDRRRRKQWLLDTFGNGTIAFCNFLGCTVELTFETITVDRFPIPGSKGGTYRRNNIRPACREHNVEHGLVLAAKARVANAAARKKGIAA